MTENAANASVRPELQGLVGRAHLLNINIVDILAQREHTAWSSGLLPEPKAAMDVTLTVQTNHPIKPPPESAAFLASLECTWMDTEGEQAVGRVRVVARLAYKFDDQSDPLEQKLLAVFADAVALHHAWPFLRERVMSLGLGLQLPPVLLPIRHLRPSEALTESRAESS